MTDRAPIAISYRPKDPDYLPRVVAAIREHMGDWPITLLTETAHLPPTEWLEHHKIHCLTDWVHTAGANKVKRLWEHQYIFAQHHERWIWWHDDMLLLRSVDNPEEEFAVPRVRFKERNRPNKELNNWHNWLWDTLNFFKCQSIAAPNPVLHIPRLIKRDALFRIPHNWDRSRLLFEPTYLLWTWHHEGLKPIVDSVFRCAVFDGALPDVAALRDEGHTILTWGKKIDHETSDNNLGSAVGTSFNTSSNPMAPTKTVP